MKRILCLAFAFFSLSAKAPALTVVIVIDQFSWHYIPKLRPYLTGGIKYLSDRGINYDNAFYDHSMPGTGPGHTMLSTGTFGSFHGIVNNRWWDQNGKAVECDDDTPEHAAVIKPDGSCYPFGKSARNIMVDTLSDQLKTHSYHHARNIVWSLSLKSRAAISMAGRLGNPIWFDDKSGNFTSSKAFFNEVPSWVKAFNNKHKISEIKKFSWKPLFPCNSPAYNFRDINNYAHASAQSSLFGRTLFVNPKEGWDEYYLKTPLANKNLIDLAIACLDKNYTGKKTDRFILWLSLSSLDKVAHEYGPHSKEAIDMVYHMDKQLQGLIDYVYSRVNKQDVLFLLTADHGIQPIPEILEEQGLDLARRHNYKDMINNLNTLIEKKFGIKKLVQNYKEPQFYLDQKALAILKPLMKKNIYNAIKDYLLSLTGIRRAWTFDELKKVVFPAYDVDQFLQRQLFKNRSGDVIFAVQPYTTVDTHITGTSHITQYAYDTQVPLIFYQPGTFERKHIVKNVSMTQVSVSLATLLEVPRPSAAAGSVLPGLK